MLHIVRKGDTLPGIARANGLTLVQLLEANPKLIEKLKRIKAGDRVSVPELVRETSSTPQTAPSAFAKKVASTAQDLHDRFQFMNEADPLLCTQIQKWTKEIGFTFTSCTEVPWSAVFVSWCFKQAGATKNEFRFAMSHSVFVHQAIKNAARGEGVFQGFDIRERPVGVGDIVQNNRRGNEFTFEFARTHSQYESHSAVVIGVGQDTQGDFAFCVGGNESDSIRRTVVRLSPERLIKQRDGSPFICIVKNLK